MGERRGGVKDGSAVCRPGPVIGVDPGSTRTPVGSINLKEERVEDMRKVIFTSAVAVLAIVPATTGVAASRGASFAPIGLFPICTPETPPGEVCETYPITTVTGISDDGRTVVGLHAFFS